MNSDAGPERAAFMPDAEETDLVELLSYRQRSALMLVTSGTIAAFGALFYCIFYARMPWFAVFSGFLIPIVIISVGCQKLLQHVANYHSPWHYRGVFLISSLALLIVGLVPIARFGLGADFRCAYQYLGRGASAFLF